MPIDGVKILCKNTNPSEWENILSFNTKVDEITGEIKSDIRTAYYRGLFFEIKPTRKDPTRHHCIIRGSLAKFYNHGIHNGFDFNIPMLRQTIEELQKRFKVNPNTAVLQHVEIGVNINTAKPPKDIIRGLIAYQSDYFTALRMDEVFTGKQIQRQEYQFKVYNKALLMPKNNLNLLRVELAIKSTKKARKYGLNTLSDLIGSTKLDKVKPDIIEFWKNMVFHDTGINLRQMTNRQKQKFLYYLAPKHWAEFSRKQRFRAKANFEALKAEFSTSTTQVEILQKLASKLEDLTAEKGNALRNVFEEIDSQKKERFTPYYKPVKRTQNHSPKKLKESSFKSVKTIRRKCRVCKKDITDKKTGALYCSKTCNNKAQDKKLKKKRRQARSLEIKELNRLLAKLKGSQLSLMVTIQKDNTLTTKTYNQSEIYWSRNKISNIKRLQVPGTRMVTLTSYRARKLIKYINDLNVKTKDNDSRE